MANIVRNIETLCKINPSSKDRQNHNKQILDLLNSLPYGIKPELASLCSYIGFADIKPTVRDYDKTIFAFLERYDKIDPSNDKSISKILTNVGKRDNVLLAKIIVYLIKICYSITDAHFTEFLKSVDSLTSVKLDIFCGSCNIFNKPKLLFDFIFKDNRHYPHNNGYYQDDFRKNLLEIIKRCGLEDFKPTVNDLEEIYGNSLIASIDILQNKYNIAPNETCLRNLCRCIKTKNLHLYDSHTKLITNLLKKGFNCDDNTLECILAMRRSEFIDLLISQGKTFSGQEKVIQDNFNCISKPETIRKLVKAGFTPTQRCLEVACLESNINIIRLLIDEYELKPNDVCLTNACTHRSNTSVINYLLENGCKPNAQAILTLTKSIKNATLLIMMEKFLELNGAQYEPLKAVYDSD